MPVISQFYGILIYMYREIGGHHNKPHIHVKYNEYEMSITIEGIKLSGNLPKKQMKLVDAWMELHKKDTKKFNTVKISGLSVEWENGADICPDELYNNSKINTVEE